MFPATSQRVPQQTSEEINEKIWYRANRRVATCSRVPSHIDRRLQELDQEWDVERTLEMNAATLAFIGSALAASRDRRWIALPLAVTGFLFQHAVQGWCPPLPILRRLGFRTMREIDEERMALKALRGDFASVRGDLMEDGSVDAMVAARE